MRTWLLDRSWSTFQRNFCKSLSHFFSVFLNLNGLSLNTGPCLLLWFKNLQLKLSQIYTFNTLHLMAATGNISVLQGIFEIRQKKKYLKKCKEPFHLYKNITGWPVILILTEVKPFKDRSTLINKTINTYTIKFDISQQYSMFFVI